MDLHLSESDLIFAKKGEEIRFVGIKPIERVGTSRYRT
jgi:hypothetical protein